MKILTTIILAIIIGFGFGLAIGAFIINDEEKKHERRK